MTATHEQYSVIGKPLPRKDAPDKVTGRSVYIADLNLPGQLHCKILRSPHAHARIVRIDTSRAEALPGVHLVATGETLTGYHKDLSSRAHTPLAIEKVTFHSQPVAAVLAETPHIAEDALAFIDVEYEPLPVMIEPEQSMAPDAIGIRVVEALDEAAEAEKQAHATVATTTEASATRPRNVVDEAHFTRGDIEQGFAEADIVVEREWRHGNTHQGYLEPHGALAHWDQTGRLNLYISTQGQFHVRNELAKILQVPQTRINVIPTEIGGGFGSKILGVTGALASILSRMAGRPVKYILTRSEDLRATVPSPQAIFRFKTGCKRDGTVTALKGEVIYNAGAYSGAPMTVACIKIGSIYQWPNLDLRGFEVLTNRQSVGAYRAPGAFQAMFALESQMDEMANAIGMDPIDFRIKNASRTGDPMAHGQPWPTVYIRETLELMKQHPAYKPGPKGEYRGVGIAVGGWLGGLQPASALVMLNPDGTWNVTVGAPDLTGTHTSLAQIAAEVLGEAYEHVHIASGDTDHTPFAGMSAGSKTIYTCGPAVKQAAEDARRQLFEMAAAELEVPIESLQIRAGQVLCANAPDKSIAVRRLAQLSTNYGGKYPPVVGVGRSAQRRQSPSFSVQLADVSVDPLTGKVTVHQYVAIQDAGFALNPLAVQGQIQGGATQGMGMALTEELIYNAEGRIINPGFIDYRLLTACDVPDIEAIVAEFPAEDGPFGAKGVGESSIVPPAGAVNNALYHALGGVRLTHAPMTPERILAALQARQAELAEQGQAQRQPVLADDN